MKIATRSLVLTSEIDLQTEIGRAFIEAYIHAARMMPLPYLTAVERQQENHDLQFVLTFEPLSLTTQVNEEAQTVDYIWRSNP